MGLHKYNKPTILLDPNWIKPEQKKDTKIGVDRSKQKPRMVAEREEISVAGGSITIQTETQIRGATTETDWKLSHHGRRSEWEKRPRLRKPTETS